MSLRSAISETVFAPSSMMTRSQGANSVSFGIYLYGAESYVGLDLDSIGSGLRQVDNSRLGPHVVIKSRKYQLQPRVPIKRRVNSGTKPRYVIGDPFVPQLTVRHTIIVVPELSSAARADRML